MKPAWVNCENCLNKNIMCWACCVENENSPYLNYISNAVKTNSGDLKLDTNNVHKL